MLYSLLSQIVSTLLLYMNVRRWNLAFVDDFFFSVIIMVMGKATMVCFSVLPMTIMLMQIVPKNIEASMFALITAVLTFSTEWGGDMSGAIIIEKA